METERQPEGYIRLEEAVQIARVSEKTVRNWAERQVVGKLKWKGLALYRRSDIETQALKQAETQVVSNRHNPPMVTQMGSAVAQALAEQLRPAAPEPEPVFTVPFDRRLYVTIAEAVQLTGLGQFYIEQHAEGRPIGPHRSVVYRRSDLEKL